VTELVTDPVAAGSILDALETGAVRAASPDPGAPDGWRVDETVRGAILDLFADRTTIDWTAGPLTFRDRATLAPRGDLAGGRGGSCPAGPPSDAAPTWAMVSW
jgi:hypothetical protein